MKGLFTAQTSPCLFSSRGTKCLSLIPAAPRHLAVRFYAGVKYVLLNKSVSQPSGACSHLSLLSVTRPASSQALPPSAHMHSVRETYTTKTQRHCPPLHLADQTLSLWTRSPISQESVAEALIKPAYCTLLCPRRLERLAQ